MLCKQLLMRSVFDNPAVIHNQDLISVFNGRNTVGDCLLYTSDAADEL